MTIVNVVGNDTAKENPTITTLKDIARETGFSIKTVSRAIHNHPDIKGETKDIIMEVVRRLGFTPNWAAQSLRSQRTNTVGFIIPNITNGFFGEIGMAVDAHFRAHGYSTLICFTSDSRDNEIASIQSLIAKNIDGIILAPIGNEGAYIDHLPNLADTPLVLIDNRLSGPPRNYVLQDNEDNSYRLATHILGHHHRHIGFVTGPLAESSSRERLAGFRKALEEVGMVFDETLVRSVDWEIRSGYQATMDLLDRSGASRPSAIIYANSQLLLGGYKAIREVGLSIPADIAVASFEHPDVIDALSPRPTTLEKAEARIGTAAAEMLQSLIESKGGLPPREILIPSALVTGESCGCKARN
ncbi:MAG TPA: LacI family DNA-binding transcriptional regulator [Rectinemataceae bacterium]|nr:LacI family DNA-binding transcriptional regulator [Rectinemataceae bacterium]